MLIQISLLLKKLSKLLFQLTHCLKTVWNIDSNQVNDQLNDLNQMLISLTFFGLSLNSADLFWAITKFR